MASLSLIYLGLQPPIANHFLFIIGGVLCDIFKSYKFFILGYIIYSYATNYLSRQAKFS